MTIKLLKTSLTIVAVVLATALLLAELVFSATARDEIGLSGRIDEPARASHNRSSTLAADFTIAIFIQPDPSGKVRDQDTSVVYSHGDSVEFSQPVSLVPNYNYDYWRFTKWTVNSSDVFTSPLELSPIQNYNVTANYARRCFSLTLAHDDGGREAADDPSASPESTYCATGKYAADEPITLKADDLEADGWRIVEWKVNEETLQNNSPEIEVPMPAEDSTITVVYEPLCYSLIVSLEPASYGSVRRSPEPNCPVAFPGNRYFVGANVTLTAEPNNGYEFVNWTDTTGVIGDQQGLTVAMTQRREITGHFQLACHRLKLEHSPPTPDSGGNPTASPNSSVCSTPGEYVVDEMVTLTANPNDGWQMEDWIIDGDNLGSTEETIQLKFPALPPDDPDYSVTAKYIKQPTLHFLENGYLVSETAGEVAIHVVRDEASSKTEQVTIDFATEAGSAEPGPDKDYISRSGTLTFGQNETEKFFNVTINDDNLQDGDKDFFVELSNPQPENSVALGEPSRIKVTIEDNEGLPRVNFSSPEFRVPESEASAGITVTLSNASTSNIRFAFDVVEGGTATNGKDYSWDESLAPTVPATMISRVIQVPLIPDDMDEPNETILLKIPAVVSGGAELGQLTEATLIIEDDDDPPGVHFADVEYFAREGDPTAPISVTLDTASSYPITVDYEVTQLSVGRQYAAQITFPPGETVQVIDVPLEGYVAGDTLEIRLNGAENAVLTAPSSVTLTVFDKDRSDCYQLVLQSNGNGNPPVTSNMDHSPGCSQGFFVRDQAIVVRAEPKPGWEIERWSGTQNDEDTSNENVVVMPDGDHTVTVFYITHAYLPNMMQQFVSYFEGPDEVEPNNALSVSQANGPLRSGREYHGSFATADDQYDIYYVYLAQQGSIQAELADIPAGRDYNLYLYSAGAQLKGYSGSLENNDEHIASGNLPKGVYYILVHVAGSAPSPAKYSLKIVYE